MKYLLRLVLLLSCMLATTVLAQSRPKHVNIDSLYDHDWYLLWNSEANSSSEVLGAGIDVNYNFFHNYPVELYASLGSSIFLQRFRSQYYPHLALGIRLRGTPFLDLELGAAERIAYFEAFGDFEFIEAEITKTFGFYTRASIGAEVYRSSDLSLNVHAGVKAFITDPELIGNLEAGLGVEF